MGAKANRWTMKKQEGHSVRNNCACSADLDRLVACLGRCDHAQCRHPRCLGLLVDSVSRDTSMASSFLSPCRDRLDAECGDLGEEAEAAGAAAAEEGEAAAAKPLKSKSSKLSGEGAGAAALEEAADEDEEPEPNAAQSASPEEEEGAASNDASHDDDDEDAAAAVGLEGTGAGAKKDVSKRVAVAGGGGEREAAGGREDAEEAEADWGDFTWLLLDFLAGRGAGSSSSLLLSLLALLWPGLAGEAGLRRGAARAADEADEGEGEGAGAAAGKLPKSAQSSSAGAAAADEAAAAARALRSLRARLASFAAAAAAAADPVALASAPAEWCRCKRSGSVTACEGCGTLFAPALSCDDTERLLAGLATPPPLSHACHCSHSASVCVMSGRLVGSTVSSRLMSAVRYLLKGCPSGTS